MKVIQAHISSHPALSDPTLPLPLFVVPHTPFSTWWCHMPLHAHTCAQRAQHAHARTHILFGCVACSATPDGRIPAGHEGQLVHGHSAHGSVPLPLRSTAAAEADGHPTLSTGQSMQHLMGTSGP